MSDSVLALSSSIRRRHRPGGPQTTECRLHSSGGQRGPVRVRSGAPPGSQTSAVSTQRALTGMRTLVACVCGGVSHKGTDPVMRVPAS